MRLVSIRFRFLQFTKIAQKLQPRRPRFLRMKLHSKKLSALHRRGKRSTVFAPAHGGLDHRRPIGVREIHERILRKSAQQTRGSAQLATGSSPRAAISPPQETSRTPREQAQAREAAALPGSTQTSTACRGKYRAEESAGRSLRRLLPAERPASAVVASKCPTPGRTILSARAIAAGSAVIADSCPRWSNAFFTEARFPAS